VTSAIIFWRTYPIYFSAVRVLCASTKQLSRLPLDERPALPFEISLTMQPRPYQEEALTCWLAEGAMVLLVLPTGAGKTLVAASGYR